MSVRTVEGGNDGIRYGEKAGTVEKSAEKMQMCVRACLCGRGQNGL